MTVALVDLTHAEEVMEGGRDIEKEIDRYIERQREKDGEREREAFKCLAKEPLMTDQYTDSSCLTMQRVAEAFTSCLLTPV